MSKLTKRGDGGLRVCYRPARKEEFYGVNIDAITKALFSANAPQTFLFHGPTGTGKTTAARFCAMLINCDSSDGVNPCLHCDSCKATMRGDQQLVRELNMADKTGIDDTRNELKKINTRPFIKGKKKILILDEAQQLTDAAQQGWLKTLEEPPEWAVLFLCTTKPEKFRGDVFNRLTAFQFHTLTEDDGVQFLLDLATNEKIELEAADAKEVFKVVGGRPRELINAVEKIKLQGKVALGNIGVVSVENAAKLGDLVKGLLGNAPAAWLITTYYDLLNQMGGSPEALSRGLGRYVEKMVRSEAAKAKQADNIRILGLTKVLAMASENLDPSKPWAFIPRMLEIQNGNDRKTN